MPRMLSKRVSPPAGDRADEARVTELLRRYAEPLPQIGSEAFGAAFDRYADARVVLIGEASHGSSEFYRARAAITQRLIERHGFGIVAVEADWPDAAAIDAHLRQRPRGDREPVFTRFPAWMWRNREVADFVEALRQWNAARAMAARVEFRGLDIYSLHSSVAGVLRYLDQADAEAAAEARRRYGCLTPWQSEPALYGREVMFGTRDCENAVVAQLQDLLARRLQQGSADGEALFDAAQNARVVRAAEHYYRLMYRSSTESWNLRDRHMFETLQALLEHRGPQSKAVVWAHNSHIGNAAATAMGWSGEFNIGELCRKAYGRDAVLIGQGTDRGTVAAADDWDEPMRVKTVLPARSDSWERLFLQAAPPASLCDWHGENREDLREALATTRLQRAIGVIYRPQSERLSHYFDAVLAEQYDAWLWFEQTHAVQPLGERLPQGPADTYPFGV
jgi:erythromycin esterase-like protein